MTAFAADPTLTMAAARDLYFQHNRFGADGGYSAAWVDFSLGPVKVPFPNTAARVRAVRFHDLHHVLTGYNTDARGEFEISAWELGSGCADFAAAWMLNLGGTFAGLLSGPARTWRAFLRGRHSRNLYRFAYDEALLARHVGELRTELNLDDRAVPPARPSDVVRFAAYTMAGGALSAVSLVFFVPMAIVANAAALLRRRPDEAARG